MSADGSGEDDEFVAEYDRSTAADVIEEAEPGSDADDQADSDEEGAVAGSFAPDVDVVPQLPSRENVAFVALGVYLGILVLAETIPSVAVSAAMVAVVTVAVAALTVVSYGILVRTTPDT